MFDKLKKILVRINADYADIRYERKKDVKIVFNGQELTEVGTNSTDGYVLRILKNGGLASIAFTKYKDAEKAIQRATENTCLIAKNIVKPVRFAETSVIKENYLPEFDQDPRQISIDEKLELTKKYNSIPMKNKNITSTSIGYTEIIREKYFVSTEGSEIREDLITNRIGGVIVSKNGTLLRNVRVGVGGSSGFAVLRNREDEFEKRTAIVLKLLQAQPVKAGVYNVILNQDLAGVFTHEAFGHFSEADLIENSPSMRKKMQIGARLGNEVLNIIDDPTKPKQLGFYKYDDEGVKSRTTQLMKNGVLVGRLHSRRTAAAFDEPLSGHCVAEDYRFAPVIRMGTIYIEPANNSFEELMERLGNGLYILDGKGGQTGGENFTFGAHYGYIVKNGKIGNMISNINISGNLYNTLKSIDAIGNDLALSELGGCGKVQINYRSCRGAPHILIKNVVVGGV